MIRIQELKKSFEKNILFDGLSLEIADKEFVVFTGASGCGKTTLLNMIGGIEPVDSGEIIVDDLNITKAKNLKLYFRQYVGFLFQNFALVENKTVAENLNMVRSQARSDISVQDALSRVGMTGTENQKVFSLSGGEQQRIALARLMVKKCSLILADEPTGSLDAANAEKVMMILSDLNKMGKTVIMVTHDSKYHNFGNKQIQIESLKTSNASDTKPSCP
ncbi:MAG: ABC transporter ATP-binding protein [Oscillospiraceae bacterium]|nr:ABC transporter ATP-binding protein [Oscillospiraceae bacterium]MBP0987450.1 ABC transporter ATP-binding protein [Oscillospiraceae bacterium]